MGKTNNGALHELLLLTALGKLSIPDIAASSPMFQFQSLDSYEPPTFGFEELPSQRNWFSLQNFRRVRGRDC